MIPTDADHPCIDLGDNAVALAFGPFDQSPNYQVLRHEDIIPN